MEPRGFSREGCESCYGNNMSMQKISITLHTVMSEGRGNTCCRAKRVEMEIRIETRAHSERSIASKGQSSGRYGCESSIPNHGEDLIQIIMSVAADIPCTCGGAEIWSPSALGQDLPACFCILLLTMHSCIQILNMCIQLLTWGS